MMMMMRQDQSSSWAQNLQTLFHHDTNATHLGSDIRTTYWNLDDIFKKFGWSWYDHQWGNFHHDQDDHHQWPRWSYLKHNIILSICHFISCNSNPTKQLSLGNTIKIARFKITIQTNSSAFIKTSQIAYLKKWVIFAVFAFGLVVCSFPFGYLVLEIWQFYMFSW